MTQDVQTAVFGGGCFWCTEALFSQLKGVVSVMPGYAGGPPAGGDAPTYEQVSSGTTGHAEVIRIEYDASQISYDDLLTVFFATHDPTTPDRQGSDVGTQYRSLILVTTLEQRAVAGKFIEELNREGEKVVTEVRPLDAFYPAEEHHRRYYENNPDAPYCQVVISPKLEKLKEKFQKLLKASGTAS